MERKWDSLEIKLSDEILKALRKLKFARTTPVQSAVIPLLMQNKDVAAQAVTGSGKTLAFVIPLLEILKKTSLKRHDIGGLILSPTRELAGQISEVLEIFLKKFPDLRQQTFIGGDCSVKDDIKKFHEDGGNILVCTPGRLEDILLGKTLGHKEIGVANGLKSLELLVLDEADRLLSMGFKNSLDLILNILPKQRRTGLFSATQTKDVDDLIRAGLRNPVLVAVKEKGEDDSKKATPTSLENHYMMCKACDKFSYLVKFLRDHNEKAILFFSTCACVEYFALILERILKERPVFALHSKKAKRGSVFESFKTSQNGLLVCTDVMARGIDIPDVRWVLQFDPPTNTEAFVHRCGRTARIGHQGSAVLFLMPSEDAYIQFIKLNQNVTLQRLDLPQAQLPNHFKEIRSWQRNDRAIFDKAQRAFVSYVQAYSKHECKWVLRVKDLDFGGIATTFNLLKLPKMPELKHKKLEGFTPDTSDLNAITYKDKQKEKSRQNKMAVYEKTGSWPGMKQPKPEFNSWSKKVEKKNRKTHRLEIKELKRKRNDAEEMENKKDLEELERDLGILKKIKKGKMSQEEFDAEIGLENFETETENC